jgi:hypothetical protein
MNAMIRFTSGCLLVATLATATSAYAQSPGGPSDYWTRSQLDSLAIRNSAAAFTTSRLQRRLVNGSVPQYSFSNNNYRGLFNSSLVGARAGKPFSGLAGTSAVTPYLSLSEPFSSSAHNYYTQVRPQLDQQRFNQQAAARARQLQQQVASLEAQPPYSPVGDAERAPTGHVAVFMNYGGYYPQVAPPRR